MAEELLQGLKNRLLNLVDEGVGRRIDLIAKKKKAQFGEDPFGFDPDTIKALSPIAMWFYRHYFRVETFGAENVPDKKVLVIANHSGQLPFDGFMLGTAFIVEPKIPRLLRGMVERWVSELPYISMIYQRAGQVVGTPHTCKTLLDRGEAVLVFPEGVEGITKLFSERYKLARFGTGFMRIALATKAPILPVAIIGAEEQAPSIANFTHLAKYLGLPALPLIFPQGIPWPLPVKYRIHIGKPLYFKGDGEEDDQEIMQMVEETKKALQKLIDHGLTKRKNIFF